MTTTFETFSGTAQLDRSLWNALASRANPMMEWEYFQALENSGSVSGECGYTPSHLVVYDGGEPVALAPLYERNRAWVEFGDGGLLEFLTEFTGMPFHRGLLGSIPFTPVPGYEFLHAPSISKHDACDLLLDHIDRLCESRGLYTSRIYFVSKEAQELHESLRERGYIALQNQYSYWFNHDYRSFADYLQSFKSSRRTKIKRELRSVRDLGIRVDMVSGQEAPDAYFSEMHALYLRTWNKHMGEGIRPFLNGAFFQALEDTFRHRIMFSVAEKSQERLGLAIFYHKGRQIFGRYWGSFTEVPFLHFSTCYYSPIDYAIRSGFQAMDPGFGGDHKLIRGFEAVPVYHYIKFHGEEPARIAMTILRRLWSNVARVRNKS
jgi:hypothetical protein